MATFSRMNIALTATAGQLFGTLKKVQTRFAGFKAAIGGVAGALRGGLGLGAFAGVAAIGAVIRSTEDFNKAMNNSLAIMGDVSDAMRNDMVVAADQIAQAFRFSAKEAAESFFFLASAGLTARQSIVALPQVAAFAQAGNFGLALATDLATDAQSALGLTSLSTAKNLAGLTRVTDVLIKANTLANASAEQFSLSLTTKAGTAAKALGKDIEEVVALIAAFADRGIKAADAGTAVNIVFRDLSTKALLNAKAFRRAKIAVFDSAGEFRNIADVIEDLEKSLAGMSDETQKATLLQLGFADKSIVFIQSVLGASEQIRNFETELRKAGGTTDEVANKQMTDLETTTEMLKGNFGRLGRAIFEFSETTLIGLSLAASDAAGALSDLDEQVEQLALTNLVQSGEDAFLVLQKLGASSQVFRRLEKIKLKFGLEETNALTDKTIAIFEEINAEIERAEGLKIPFTTELIESFKQLRTEIESIDDARELLKAIKSEFEELERIQIVTKIPIIETERLEDRFRRLFFPTEDDVNSAIKDVKRFTDGARTEIEHLEEDLSRVLSLKAAGFFPIDREFDRIANNLRDKIMRLEPPVLGPSRQEAVRGRAESQQAFREQFKSPFERFTEELDKLKFAFPSGGEIFRRGLEDLRKRFLPEAKKQIPELFDLATIDQRIQKAALKGPSEAIPQKQLTMLEKIWDLLFDAEFKFGAT